MYKPISRLPYLLLLLTWIGVFGSSVYYVKSAPAVTPEVVFTNTPVPSLVPAFETRQEFEALPDIDRYHLRGWSVLRPGLERRVIDIYNDQNQHVESLHIWRLDQKSFRMDVAYDDRPKSLETWQAETNAALVVNGGYYSIENERYFPDGLTISQAAFDKLCDSRMLAINEARQNYAGRPEPITPSSHCRRLAVLSILPNGRSSASDRKESCQCKADSHCTGT
jgi:hypothetical protein